MRDSIIERAAYGRQQPTRLTRGKRVGACQRVQSGSPESLINVDVAQAGHKVLIEQQRLELAAPGMKHGGKRRVCQRLVEWLWAKAAEHLLGIIYEIDSPELAKIAQAQRFGTKKPSHTHIIVCTGARDRVAQTQTTRHP